MVEKSKDAPSTSKGILSILKRKQERGIQIKPKQAVTIGVFSCKGGVGKTTTVANTGICLAQKMKDDVLIVDANLTAPNLGLHFGEFNPRKTIHDVLSNKMPIEEAIQKYHGLQALFGSIAYGEEVHLVDLRSYLEPLKKKFKIILLDSAPGMGSEVISAMKACDEMLVVTNPDVPTITSTLKTFAAAEQYKIPVAGAVINKVFGGPFELPIKDVRKALGWPIVAIVPEDMKVREATAAGIPVVIHEPKSRAAAEFMELAKFLMKRTP